MAQPKRKENRGNGRGASRPPALADLSLEERRQQRLERKEINRRVDDLKLRVHHFAENHMEQVLCIVRRWLVEK